MMDCICCKCYVFFLLKSVMNYFHKFLWHMYSGSQEENV